jgi:nucleotide-binding universal stress UspA family protein
MVAADGSEESLAALAVVKHRHWPAGTHCAIVTVVDPRMESSVAWPGVYASDWVQQRDAEAREWVARMTEQYFRELESVGLRTETHVFDGDPKQVLAKQADEFGVSCVFLGARGLQHGLSRALGSVATALAARAHCSVEVVRTDG